MASDETPDVLAPSPPDEGVSDTPFPVVGVGASAGGLEAYSELLEALPADPGMAFLFVSHLDPDHKSHLTEILARVSKMPVKEVTDGMAVEKDHVYCIPPGTTMALVDGHLNLVPRPPKPIPHMPIDHLFRSLAAIQKSRAIGIVLSGNGTDGAIALQEIKAVGGITFAQDEASAKHPGMPRAAVLDGGIDHVLRPREIALHLSNLGRHAYARPGVPAEAPDSDPTADIIRLLLARTGVDFAHYKQATIRRRILRRMALLNLHEPANYLEALQDDAAEVQALYQDLLIRVTQFFRDPAAFDALQFKVFPHLIQPRRGQAPLRLWVAGCATGEEVYSLAICLLEYLDGQPQGQPIKILATDLNEAALEKARAGIYLDNIEIDVSPERLRRFFVRTDGGGYQISKSIRELCVFSRHNLTADPPFSRIDLVSCRNVLIYMDQALQKRVLPTLHYALNPDGYLLLGSSENIGSYTDLFNVVDSRNRIFAKKLVAAGVILDYNPQLAAEGWARPPGRPDNPQVWNALDVQKEADRILLSRYAPVGVVVDEAMTVLQFRGRTAAYLEPAPGMASLDLLRMLREGLLAEVRSAVNQAKTENTPATRDGLFVINGAAEARPLRIEVVPFKLASAGVRFFLVLFQDSPAPPPTTSPTPPTPAIRASAAEQQTVQLQHELTALREYLQSVIEEQESTNEELKSANEEILSSNEELQSTNEELQTAKEEAQSANEELATVNEELRHRNAELGRVNSDLVNLLSGVGIPIVMVSRDLRIRRFTPLAERLFNLIPTDVGRPIGDIKPNLAGVDLPQLIARVIDTLTQHEGMVKDTGGHSYLMRIRPYVTTDQKIDGASIVLLDVDAIKRPAARG